MADAWEWTKGAASDAWGFITDPFRGETVSTYNPNPYSFTLGPTAQNSQYENRLAQQDLMMQAYQGGQGATQVANAGIANTSAMGDALDRTYAQGMSGAATQAQALQDQAAFARQNTQVARPLTGIAGQYDASGAGAQGSAMTQLGNLASGQMADAQASRGLASSMAGYQGTPEQQAALGRAQAAQAQTAQTGNLSAVGSQLGGLAFGQGVRDQQGVADQLARPVQDYGQQGEGVRQLEAFSQGGQGAPRSDAVQLQSSQALGDFAQQRGTSGYLQQFAEQGPGESAAQAQLRQGQDAAVAGQMALARSGRGGASATALRQAQANAAGIQQQTNAQAAQLRAQEQQAWRGQQLQALQGATSEASQARGQNLQALQADASQQQALNAQRLQQAQAGDQTALAQRGQSLQALQAAAGARGQMGATLGSQQLQGLQAAGGLYGQATGQQISALQGQAGVEGQALSARDAAATRQLQALGIEAQQAQALGGQQLSAQQAALGAWQQQQALQAQAAQAQAQAGAAYGAQGLAAQQAATGVSLQGQQIDDARAAALRDAALQQQQLGLGYGQLRSSTAGTMGGLEQGWFGAGTDAYQQAIQGQLQAGLGYGGMQQNYDLAQFQALQDLERMKGDWQIGVQTANQAADTQRDSSIMGMAGSILAGFALSDVRAKQNIISGDEMSDAYGAAMAGSYDASSAQKRIDQQQKDDEKRKAIWQNIIMGMQGQQPSLLSDERAKTVKRGPATEALAKAPGYAYEYKPEIREAFGQPDGMQYGPMAQDLERTPVGETAVREGPGGLKQIDSGRLSLVNASATGELDARLQRLEKMARAK